MCIETLLKMNILASVANRSMLAPHLQLIDIELENVK